MKYDFNLPEGNLKIRTNKEIIPLNDILHIQPNTLFKSFKITQNLSTNNLQNFTMLAAQIGQIETPVTFVNMTGNGMKLTLGLSESWQKLHRQVANVITYDMTEPSRSLRGHTVIIANENCMVGKKYQRYERQLRKSYPGLTDIRYVAIANWSQLPIISLIEGDLEWEEKKL